MATIEPTERGQKVLGRTMRLTSDSNSVVRIPASRRRVALQIGNISAANWFLNLSDNSPGAGQGVPIPINAAPVLLTAAQIGDAVSMAMQLVINAASTDVFINEFVEGD